jgi:hypothetical protein
MRRPAMHRWLLSRAAPLLPVYLSATRLWGGSRRLKRIERGLIISVATAFIAWFARLFSATKVTFVIWWILGLAAEWVNEET